METTGTIPQRMSICCENGESILQTAGWRGHETLSARTTKGRKQVNVAVQMRMTRTAIMMTFVGTETLVTQLENERSRVHATEVPATGQSTNKVEGRSDSLKDLWLQWRSGFVRLDVRYRAD